MNEHRNKEADDYGEEAAKQVTAVYGKVRLTSTFLSDVLRVAQMTVMGIPILGQAVKGFGQLWQVALSSLGLVKKEGKWTRGIKTIGGLAALGLLIGAVAAPAVAAVLGVVSVGLGFGQEIWTLSAAFISRASGSWNKEREALQQKENEFNNLLNENPQHLAILTQANQINNKINNIENEIIVLQQKIQKAGTNDSKEQLGSQLNIKKIELISMQKEKITFVSTLSPQQKQILSLDKEITSKRNALSSRDGDLAGKSFNFLVGGLALAGAVMLVTPLAPIGAMILLSTSIYGLLKTFDPFGWTGKVKNQFFGPQTKPIEPIKKDIDKDMDKHLEKNGPAPSKNNVNHIFQKLAQKNGNSVVTLINHHVDGIEKAKVEPVANPSTIQLSSPVSKEIEFKESEVKEKEEEIKFKMSKN